MSKENVETFLPNSFKKLYERIAKILRDNGEPVDVKADASRELQKLDMFAKVLHKVQTNLLTSNISQKEIKAMILGMRQEIATMIGSKSSEDVE